MDKSLILLKYQEKISELTNSYLKMYRQQVAKQNRTIDTGNEFLETHQARFQKEVGSITIQMCLNYDYNSEYQKIIVENNPLALSSLRVEIMNELNHLI